MENKKCCLCNSNAEIDLHQLNGVFLCKNCALEIYKSLAKEFVPKAIPNVVLKANEQKREVMKSIFEEKIVDEKTHFQKPINKTQKTRRIKCLNSKKN